MSLKSLPIQSFKMCKNVQKKLKNSIDTALPLCEIDRTHGTNRNNNNQKMRTKTLLIAAAALAAAITSSQAQTVYSANVVGYANLALTPGNFELVAPTFDLDGTGTNGTISTVVGTNVAVETTLLIWNGSGYTTLTFSPLSRGAAPVWNQAGVAVPNFPLNVGEGFFIDDPSDTNLTVSGQVMSGSVANSYVQPAGTYALVSSVVPFGGDITTNLNYIPSTEDTLLVWNGAGYTTYTYSPLGRGQPSVWNVAGVQQDPQISVGQGFFLDPAVNNTWTETFTNN